MFPQIPKEKEKKKDILKSIYIHSNFLYMRQTIFNHIKTILLSEPLLKIQDYNKKQIPLSDKLNFSIQNKLL